MLDNNKIKNLLLEMTKSPLFYLFVASKELFHSNFLYWLSIINKNEFITLICPLCELGNEIIIEREKNVAFKEIKAKIDFYISGSNSKNIIIENKVKDYPEIKQLHRISNAFESNNNNKYILLTLFTDEYLAFLGWDILTYKELSNRIVPEKFSNNEYFQSLIHDYKKFINTLALFSESLKTSNDYDFAIDYDKELFNLLNSYNLWESFQKMRASHLISLYKKRYEKDNIKIRYGINNQKATIDFFVEIMKNTEIGIQIENDQYRKFINTDNANIKIKALIDESIFFSKSFRSPQNKLYLNYGERFKYQYDKINNPVAMDLLFKSINSELSDSVINNLEKIRNILNCN